MFINNREVLLERLLINNFRSKVKNSVYQIVVRRTMTEQERTWDKLLKIKTIGRDDSNVGQYCYPYEAMPYAVLERLANSGLIRKKDVVLDYGCGKGRVVFFFSIRPRQRLSASNRMNADIGVCWKTRRLPFRVQRPRLRWRGQKNMWCRWKSTDAFFQPLFCGAPPRSDGKGDGFSFTLRINVKKNCFLEES